MSAEVAVLNIWAMSDIPKLLVGAFVSFVPYRGWLWLGPRVRTADA